MITKIIRLAVVLLLVVSGLQAKQIINIKPSSNDMTMAVRTAIESANDTHLKLVFEKGVYHFTAKYAANRYYPITNHDNGFKHVIFQAEGFESIEIEGNGSVFIFNDRVAPFIFEDCKQVKMSNLTIDWKIPFIFQGQLLDYNKEEGWRDIKPFINGYSWKFKDGKICFPIVDGLQFSDFGQSINADPKTKDIVYGAKGMHSHAEHVEKRSNNILRIHEKLKYYPPIGTIQGSVGYGEKRYAPGIYVKSSRNIHFDGVIIHHALGMGFLFERAENIKLLNSGVYASKESDRVISTVADATHFCNCKGDVLVENCRFENMMDDGTNVHGTYVLVDEVINKNTVRVAIQHRQQRGFVFAAKGDAIWCINRPSSERAELNRVISVRTINDEYSELTFKEELPAILKKGDVLENKTWNPTFTMRGCNIGGHRARNIVLKTPLKIVIENNRFFSSDMASILFRGEMHHWFESGAVKDVLIQNNYFSYCAHGASGQPLLYISPKALDTFDQTTTYDRNIRFINNTIETFDNRIVWADRVDGLVIKGNTIKQNTAIDPLLPEAPMIELSNCNNAIITDNQYVGNNKNVLTVDEKTKLSLEYKYNKGFDTK